MNSWIQVLAVMLVLVGLGALAARWNPDALSLIGTNPQTTYDDQSAIPALEGGLFDTGHNEVVTRSVSGTNTSEKKTFQLGTPTIAVAQISKVQITTATDSKAWTVDVGDFHFAGTTGTSQTVTTVRDQIKAAMDADTAFSALYTVATSSTDAITITARRAGVGFVLNGTFTSTLAATLSTPTANVVGTQYQFVINEIAVQYAAASTSATTERDALLAVLLADPILTDTIEFAAVSTNQITFTAISPGVPFTATYANKNYDGVAGTGTNTFTDTTANVDATPILFGRAVVVNSGGDGYASLPSLTGQVFEGVSVNHAKAMPKLPGIQGTGVAGYQPGEAFPVLRRGRIWVKPEDAVDPSKDVYFRYAVDPADATHTVGRFRGSNVSSYTDKLSASGGLHARWLNTASADTLALLEISVP